MPKVPRGVRTLLGPTWIVGGEDPDRFEELLGQAGAAFQPRDIIDWLLVYDYVVLIWETQRAATLQSPHEREACRSDGGNAL
jgi:hypothetical protein